MEEQTLTDWVLFNKHQIYMLLLAIRQYKKQPMRPQFAEYLRQAESKLRDALHLIRQEEFLKEEQQEAEEIWEGSHHPGSRAPWLGPENRE